MYSISIVPAILGGSKKDDIKGEDSMTFRHIGSAPTSIRVRFALRIA